MPDHDEPGRGIGKGSLQPGVVQPLPVYPVDRMGDKGISLSAYKWIHPTSTPLEQTRGLNVIEVYWGM